MKHDRLLIYKRALEDIANLHEKGLEDVEKLWGFTGWTCCGQKTEIAEIALGIRKRQKIKA